MTFSTITKAWHVFVNNKKLLPLIVLVDILFVYGISRLHYEVFSRASEFALNLTTMMGQQVQTIESSGSVANLSVMGSQAFADAYAQLLKYIGIFVVSAFIVWLVCKGIVWFLAHKTAREKPVPAGMFALKFFGMTCFWFLMFAITTVIAINIIDYATTSVFPLIGIKVANVISILLYWALAYFMFISYSLVPHNVFRQTFILGIKEWKELLPAHILGTIVIILSVIIPAFLVRINLYLILAFSVLVALPAIAWARVLWITAVHKVMNHGQD
jgi:hypothetical protein